MDNKVKIGITVGVVVLVCCVATAFAIHAMIDEREEDFVPCNLASQLSEHGGYISLESRYVYVNSAYHVIAGADVYQDETGIWVHTTQGGCDKLICFHWEDIDAVMLDTEVKE